MQNTRCQRKGRKKSMTKEGKRKAGNLPARWWHRLNTSGQVRGTVEREKTGEKAKQEPSPGAARRRLREEKKKTLEKSQVGVRHDSHPQQKGGRGEEKS